MARRQLRTIKLCSHCGSGFDAFRALDARGRYCSPECLAGARQANRERGRVPVEVTPQLTVRIDTRGPAMIPTLAVQSDEEQAGTAIA